MTHAVWTPLAESELEEILFYIRIADGRPETARRIALEIRECADRQTAANVPGHIHPAAPEGWTYFKYKRWLLFYQPHSDGIEVMRMVDGSRDLPVVLNE